MGKNWDYPKSFMRPLVQLCRLKDNLSLVAMVMHLIIVRIMRRHTHPARQHEDQLGTNSKLCTRNYSVVKQKDCKMNEILKILTQKRIPPQTKIMICEL
uniref:Uncharacterized protein n=1 Tax=Strigamia maritima TaxID=126957 RepID=T1IYC4_STRMM